MLELMPMAFKALPFGSLTKTAIAWYLQIEAFGIPSRRHAILRSSGSVGEPIPNGPCAHDPYIVPGVDIAGFLL
jgi:hypothetical protein